jgi:4-hydroxybenzoyl-CoA thioesterase
MTNAPETAPANAAGRTPENTRAGAGVFRTKLPVRFSHCDPAGIVFYPRYLEMFNDIVEEWLRESLQFSLTEIVTRRGWGLPTVHLDVDFTAPSYFGETLDATLELRKVGTSSMHVEMALCGPDGKDRVRGRVVLVLIERAAHRAISIPSELRARLAAFQAGG